MLEASNLVQILLATITSQSVLQIYLATVFMLYNWLIYNCYISSTVLYHIPFRRKYQYTPFNDHPETTKSVT